MREMSTRVFPLPGTAFTLHNECIDMLSDTDCWETAQLLASYNNDAGAKRGCERACMMRHMIEVTCQSTSLPANKFVKSMI